MYTDELIAILSATVFLMAFICIGLVISTLLFQLPSPWGGIVCVFVLVMLCLLGYVWAGKLKKKKGDNNGEV